MPGFKDIIGHGNIIEHLQSAIRLDKVSHAYILSGEKGAGKKMLADTFAMALQCEQKEADPCMECSSCKKAMGMNHPDIIRISHEKPNSIGVEDIRTQLIGDVSIKPYIGPYKVYIVDEAEKMTVQAQNALLKTIEEPPEYAVVILLTTNAEGFLPTILSRCVTLTLKVVPEVLIKKYLMEKLQIPDYQAEVSVAFAQGNVGRAVKLATSENFNQIKNNALYLIKYIAGMEIHEVVEAVKLVSQYKLEIEEYLDIMIIWYRDVLIFKATREVSGLIFKDEINYITEQLNRSSYEGIETIIEALETAKVRLRANVNFELVMELLFLTIKEN